MCNKRINLDGNKCRARSEPVVFQKIAFLRTNFICELAEVKVKLRWIHIVPGGSYPGYQRFFLANVARNRPKADATSGLSGEKTSEPERFDLLFSLNFDLFYPITFKPITADVSCGTQ